MGRKADTRRLRHGRMESGRQGFANSPSSGSHEIRASRLPRGGWFVIGTLVLIGAWIAYLSMTVPYEECERLMRAYEASTGDKQTIQDRLDRDCPAWGAMR